MSLAIHPPIGAVPHWRVHDSDDDCASHGSGVGAGLVSDGPRAGQEGVDAEAAGVIEGHHYEGLVAEDNEGRAEDDEHRTEDNEGRAENDDGQGDAYAEDHLVARDEVSQS